MTQGSKPHVGWSYTGCYGQGRTCRCFYTHDWSPDEEEWDPDLVTNEFESDLRNGDDVFSSMKVLR